ncbi:ATP-binding cassette domain-containing protein, partial [Streptomyces sp. 2MCAF27]
MKPEPPATAPTTVPAETSAEASAETHSETSAEAPAVISLRGATASLGGRPVLRGVDLTVRRGEVVALLGANGSGKSTAVRSVVGQVPLSGGELRLFDTPSRRFRDWARIGYVPQRTTAASGVPA